MKHYSKNFKVKAVGRYYLSGNMLSKTATEVGVSPATLYRWVNEENITVDENIIPANGVNAAMLIVEIKALREENEILCKALMYMAKTSEVGLK